VAKKNPTRGGRPPQGDRAFDDRFLFECMSEDKARWLAKATAEGESLGSVIRRLLNRWSRR
jgi:hypothetical protein